MNSKRLDVPGDDASRNEHQYVWALLPWIANGTASAEQRAQAQAHLAHCADCNAELRLQLRLRQGLAQQEPAVALDTEAGLQGLLGRLDAPPMQEQPMPAPPAPRRRSPLIAAMAAAIFAQAIGLGVLGIRHTHPGGDGYITLSQPDASAPKGAILTVVPAPTMTMAEWQQLLYAHGLRVVGGPNSMGAYELAPAGSDKASAEGVEGLLKQLRQVPGLTLVEPIVH